MKTQYDADETRRKTFRQELHGNIEKGLKARKYSECLPGRVKKLCETWPIDNDEIVINFARAFGEDYTFENIKYRIYYNDYKSKNDNNKIYKIWIYEGVKINSELLTNPLLLYETAFSIIK